VVQDLGLQQQWDLLNEELKSLVAQERKLMQQILEHLSEEDQWIKC
jgi:hypothetical protein